MKKIIKVVNSDSGKIIFYNKCANIKDNESALISLANSNLDLSVEHLEISITTIKEDFKVGEYCYYNDIVGKIIKVDYNDYTAKVLLFEKPIKTNWLYLKDLIKIDNEDLEEDTND